MRDRSSTDIHEKELSRWLWTGSPIARLLPQVLHIAPGSYLELEVPTTELAPGTTMPGDIDVLAASLKVPEHAAAIELKRIEVTADSFRTGLPGKLAALERGVDHVNALAELGFHRTWLLVAIVTGAREQAGGELLLAGPTAEILRTINEYPLLSQLSPNVGLVLVEATQPVDRETGLAGRLGVHLRREAIPNDQPTALTAGILTLLRRRLGEQAG